MAGSATDDYHFHYVSTDERYESDPLQSSSHIRLLMLNDLDERTGDTVESPLTGFIFHEDCSTESKYIILSLAIDIGPATETLETAEGSMSITKSLHDALSSLRRMATSPLAIWTPEISLDRKRYEERQMSSRIRAMKEIYTNAYQIIAYLGEDDDNTAIAHDFFSNLSSIDVGAALKLPEDVRRSKLPSSTNKGWVALDRFLCRPWFRSIQALPACIWAKHLQFVGERWSLDAKMFVNAVLKANALRIPIFGQGINTDELVQNLNFFLKMAAFRVQYSTSGQEFAFSQLLRVFQDAEAFSEPDRLTILAAVSDKSEEAAKYMSTSDSSTLSEEAEAMWLVQFLYSAYTDGIELLSLASGCEGDSDLPSWMPSDGSRNGKRRCLEHSRFQTTAAHISEGATGISNAKKLTVLCAPVPCSCVGHNSIAIVSENIQRTDNTAPYVAVISEWQYVRNICSVLRSETGEPMTKYPANGQAPLEAAWETLCKGERWGSTPSDLSESMASAKAMFMAMDTDDRDGVVARHSNQARDALDFFEDELEGWHFCVTQTGYMGLVPREAQAGDVVMAVNGAKVPFVFRKLREADNYTLIGECYLHGIMHNELDGKLRFKEIYIN